MVVMPDYPATENETGLSQILSNVDRQRAFRAARRHSAAVKALRIVFPIIAVSAASLYMVNAEFSFSVGDFKGKFDSVDVSAKHLKMIKPRLQGFNDKHGEYVIKASEALQSIENPDVIQLTLIDAKITNADTGWTQIFAKAGTFHSKKDFLNLRDGIKVISSSGVNAELKAADIDMKKQLITAKSPVAVSMTNGTVHSNNMEIATSIRKMKFSNAVRVHLRPSDKARSPDKLAKSKSNGVLPGSNKPIDITAERLEILDKDKLAVFSGNVNAEQDGLRLNSDRLRIRYEGEANTMIGSAETSITTIEARDNVVMTTPENRKATSDWSIFDTQKRVATLGGNVILYQGENRLQGQKLLFDMATRRTIFPAGGRVKGRFVPAKSGKSAVRTAAKSPPAGPGDGIAASFAGLGANNDKPIFVEADTLNIFDGANRAVFRGNVELEQGGYQLYAQTLEMVFSGNGKSAGRSGSKTDVSKIIAIEQVRLISPDGQSVTSDKAVYDVKTNIVTINDNVVLTRGKDIIKGDQLTIDLTTRRSWVKNYGKAGAKQRVRMLLGPRSFQKGSSQGARFGLDRP